MESTGHTTRTADMEKTLRNVRRPCSTPEEVDARLRRLADRHGGLAVLKHARSSEGRPLTALLLRDSSVAEADKQHVLVVAGRHGNEESGRMLAFALAEWLVGTAGRRVLAAQTVAILADANPDAAAANVHHHPCGVNVGSDLDTPAPLPESLFIENLARRLQPDLFLDLHARGYAGCSHDMVLYPSPRPYTEDDNLLHAAAAAMCAAGERSGLPQLTHPLEWWEKQDKGSCARYYRLYKSLALLSETSESDACAHPVELRRRSGLAKLKAALALGQARHPKLRYAGYPNQLVLGTWLRGIVAVGRNAAQRRRSRVAIWRNADRFAEFGAGPLPEEDRVKRARLRYEGEPLQAGIGVQLQSRHRQAPMAVRLNGRACRYTCWLDACGSFVVVEIPRLRSGTQEIEVRF